MTKIVANLSHTANSLEAKLKNQTKEIAKLKTLLHGRDAFIVSVGLWQDFTNQLPSRDGK